jgi:hypothetical protein
MKTISFIIFITITTISFSFGQVIPVCSDLDWTTTTILSFNCEFFEHGDWVLVYSNEFNDDLDANEWFKRTPWGNKSSEEMLSYTTPDNQLVEDGNLKLFIKNEPGWYQNPYYSNPPTYEYYLYTSAEVWSKAKYRFGKIEASIKIPKGPGFVPAFWMFGDCGDEIDIFEFAHAETEKPLITIHKYAECGDESTHEKCGIQRNYHTDFSLKHHVYSVEWDEFKVIFKIDDDIKRIDYKYKAINGQEGWITDCNNITPGNYLVNPYFPNDRMPIIFGIQISNIGQAFYDENHAQGPFPSSMDIEYVKVYRKSNYMHDIQISDLNSSELSSAITGRNVFLGRDSLNSPVVTIDHPLTIIATEKILLLPGFKAEKNSLFISKVNQDQSESPISNSINQNVPTSINNSYLNDGNILIYPNPTTGKFMITLPKFNGTIKIEVTSPKGQQVLSKTTKSTNVNIDLSGQNPGIYFVNIITDSMEKRLKIIKL